jgi:hypothetical protein
VEKNMSLKNFVIDCLRAQKLSRFDTLKNAVDKIKHGAISNAASEYAAKKNGLYDVSVREAVRGYDDFEAYDELVETYEDIDCESDY